MKATQVPAVRVRACAKVNLTLRVLGVRNDGFHELRTTFQSLALHDTLTFTRASGAFSIDSNDPLCPVDSTNLVWQAAARLWRAARRRGPMPGTRVHLHKRIPAQAGLGGGSSDAAATLRALPILWRLRLAPPEVAQIARDLGADVAFFLEGGTVLGVERGDLLFPLLDAPRRWVVVLRPGFGVSTRDAYAWWDEASGRGPRRRTRVTGTGDWTGELINDLERPVVARHPQISRLVSRLRACGANRAAMSGSGSAVFGLFEERAGAERAATRLAGPSVAAWVTRTLTRREYQRTSAVRPLPR